jgi:hypothetical protein
MRSLEIFFSQWILNLSSTGLKTLAVTATTAAVAAQWFFPIANLLEPPPTVRRFVLDVKNWEEDFRVEFCCVDLVPLKEERSGREAAAGCSLV